MWFQISLAWSRWWALWMSGLNEGQPISKTLLTKDTVSQNLVAQVSGKHGGLTVQLYFPAQRYLLSTESHGSSFSVQLFLRLKDMCTMLLTAPNTWGSCKPTALNYLNSTNTWKARSLPNMSEKHICIKLCLHQLQEPMENLVVPFANPKDKKAGQEGWSLRKGDALNQTSCNRPHHVGGHKQWELGTSRRDLTVQLYFPAQRSLLSASQPNTVSGPDKSATKAPTLPATTTQQRWCVHNFFLTCSYQIQPAPFPKKWIGKANKYEFNWTTLQKQAKDTNDTNQRISQTKSPS